MRTELVALLAAITFVSLALHALFALLFAVRARYAIGPDAPVSREEPDATMPGVSILKPCAGADDDLETCLRSFCALRYPKFEILCGVRDDGDPALAVIERVRAAHPNVAMFVVRTRQGRSVNPKVAQLEVLERVARHDVLWISDSNTRVHPDTLASMVGDLSQPGVGLVVSPVVGTGERTIGAALDNLHVSAFITVSTFAVNALTGRIVAPGKSMLFRRSSLEAVGGCAELGRYCAEDFILVERLRERGERVVIGRHLVANVNVGGDLAKFYRRHFRWTQMHWLLDRGTWLEILLYPIAFAALWLVASPTMNTLVAAALVVLVQGSIDALVLARLRDRGLPMRLAAAAAIRPIVFAALWFASLFSRRVEWRGNVRWLGDETLLLEQRPAGLRFIGAR